MGGVATGASSTALLPRSPAAQFPEAEAAECAGASHLPAQGKRECCTGLWRLSEKCSERVCGWSYALCFSAWFSTAQIHQVYFSKFFLGNIFNWTFPLLFCIITLPVCWSHLSVLHLFLRTFRSKKPVSQLKKKKPSEAKQNPKPWEDPPVACLFISRNTWLKREGNSSVSFGLRFYKDLFLKALGAVLADPPRRLFPALVCQLRSASWHQRGHQEKGGGERAPDAAQGEAQAVDGAPSASDIPRGWTDRHVRARELVPGSAFIQQSRGGRKSGPKGASHTA